MRTNKISKDIKDFIEDQNDVPWTDQIDEDFHILVYKDAYPVTKDHVLYVPKYNSISVLTECFESAFEFGKNKVDSGEWDGFNIGFNYKEAAGQTVKWPHVHLIPRRKGDMEDPTGGVRHVIPEKGNYKKGNYKK